MYFRINASNVDMPPVSVASQTNEDAQRMRERTNTDIERMQERQNASQVSERLPTDKLKLQNRPTMVVHSS
jgi:hypothetical protein